MRIERQTCARVLVGAGLALTSVLSAPRAWAQDDLHVAPRKVAPKAQAPRKAAPARELATEPSTTTDAKAEPSEDSASEATVAALVLMLRGATLHERVALFEAFVREHPHSRFAPTLYEEASVLRELAALRIALPPEPLRPEGALERVPTGGALPEAEPPAPQPAPATEPPLVEPAAVPALAPTSAEVVGEVTSAAGVHEHDGFFLRFSGGGGYLGGGMTVPLRPCDGCAGEMHEATLSAGTSHFEMLIGGAPTPGLDLALKLGMLMVGESSASLDSDPWSQGDLTFEIFPLTMIGGHVDIYPMSEHGLHVFASAGMALAGELREVAGRVPSGGLLGYWIGAGIGHEWWMSEQWSVGLQVRVDGGRLSNGGDAGPELVELDYFAPTGQVNLTYN